MSISDTDQFVPVEAEVTVIDGRPGWRGFAAVPLLKKMQEQIDRLRDPGDDDDVPAPPRFGQESGT